MDSAEIWDRIVLHVITHETSRNRAMVLIAYDGALRREELNLLLLPGQETARVSESSPSRESVCTV